MPGMGRGPARGGRPDESLIRARRSEQLAGALVQARLVIDIALTHMVHSVPLARQCPVVSYGSGQPCRQAPQVWRPRDINVSSKRKDPS